MTAARELERLWARRRAAMRAKRSEAAQRLCLRCLRPGHEKADCTAQLAVWARGPDMMIAENAARAARIFNDPFGPDSPDDFYSAAADWTRVEGAALTLNGVTLPPMDWVDLYGEGWLAVDGELAPRDP